MRTSCPRFIQIAVTAASTGAHLFALDENGRVWCRIVTINDPATEWYLLSNGSERWDGRREIGPSTRKEISNDDKE